jgi:hypothetical protein
MADGENSTRAGEDVDYVNSCRSDARLRGLGSAI